MNPRYEAVIADYEQTRDLRKFAEGLEAMERRGEGFFLVHLQLGVAYNGLSRIRDAVEAFRRAVALDPENYLAQYEFGNALAAAKCDDEAIQAFHAAARLDTTRSEPLANAANRYLRLRKYDEAASTCAQALSRNPDDPVALRTRDILDRLFTIPPEKRADMAIEVAPTGRPPDHGAP